MMPYIKQDDRMTYDGTLAELMAELAEGQFNPGDVNYVFTTILLNWWHREPCYKTVCLIMGTCSAVAQEFYRRVASNYEDKKILENGDV